MKAALWSENTPFPEVCDYHQYGCSCDSPVGLSSDDLKEGDRRPRCDYCASDVGTDCRCCECECECEDFLIDAASFNQWIKDTCYVCDSACFDIPEEKLDTQAHICVKNLGEYSFYLKNFPTYISVPSQTFMGIPVGKTKRRRAKLSVMNEDGLKSEVMFSGPVLIPVLAKGDRVWMSLTPNEIYTMRDVLEDIKGKVLVGGLGMGWLTSRLCEKSEVTKVVQVELDPGIIDFFGKPLLESHSKLSIVQGDAYQFAEQSGDSWDAVLFDIWPYIGEATMDQRFQTMAKRFRKKGTYVWGWGDIR